MKKLLGILSSLTLLATALPAAGAQWSPTLPTAQGEIGIIVTEQRVGDGVSMLQYYQDERNSYLCETIGVAPCDKQNFSLSGTLVLPTCQDSKSENCIEGLRLRSEELGNVDAQFIEYVEGPTFRANPRAKLSEGATGSKWSAPGFLNSAGVDTFYVQVSLAPTAVTRGVVEYNRASLTVIPYSEQLNPDLRPIRFSQEESDGRNYVLQSGPNIECVWQETGACGIAEEFPLDTTISLTVRLSSEIGGWFGGRLTKPNIAVTRLSGSSNRIVISGEPVVIQRVSVVVQRQDATAAFLKEFDSGSGPKLATLPQANGQGAFDALKAVRTQTTDTSSGQNSAWALETVNSYGHPCLSDNSRVNGIVTTNATAYQPGVPTFTKGFLNYKVGGLHYESDGVTKAQGSYDLVMRSDVARCLYGLSRAPVSATISVAGDGDRSIATTVVGERNGWLKLAAYGFTFSEKTVKVKLTNTKRTTITCVALGKTARKVTAVNPKCPKGLTKR